MTKKKKVSENVLVVPAAIAAFKAEWVFIKVSLFCEKEVVSINVQLLSTPVWVYYVHSM